MADELYPETKLLRQVHGIGALTALAFVLTLEDSSRFAKSRQVGPYPRAGARHRPAGQSDPQKGISEHGNEIITRKFLVDCAHYVFGPFSEDSDLRRHGEKIDGRGSKNATKRAVVARKLSVLVHRLRVTAEVYEPLCNVSRYGDRPARGRSAARAPIVPKDKKRATKIN